MKRDDYIVGRLVVLGFFVESGCQFVADDAPLCDSTWKPVPLCGCPKTAGSPLSSSFNIYPSLFSTLRHVPAESCNPRYGDCGILDKRKKENFCFLWSVFVGMGRSPMKKIVSVANSAIGHGEAVGRVSVANEGRLLGFRRGLHNGYPYIHELKAF